VDGGALLGAIFLTSLKLMYYMDREPNADMTIKVTAHQWYWSYEYPDQAGLTFDSNLIPDKDLKPGEKRLLEVDNPLVVPVGATVRVQVTGTDVIHSWFVPSFSPGICSCRPGSARSWFQVVNAGTYYGECNQICGVNHAFMPIKVVALAKQFDKWLGEAKENSPPHRLAAARRRLRRWSPRRRAAPAGEPTAGERTAGR
jgi:cytochrome c oxidase subunit 2